MNPLRPIFVALVIAVLISAAWVWGQAGKSEPLYLGEPEPPKPRRFGKQTGESPTAALRTLHPAGWRPSWRPPAPAPRPGEAGWGAAAEPAPQSALPGLPKGDFIDPLSGRPVAVGGGADGQTFDKLFETSHEEFEGETSW